jgi:hypothetical protein
MAYVDWMIRTKQIATCSCDYGCFCEFNAPPTRVPCEGVMAMEITEGHFASVSLAGLRVAGAYRWPGAVHEGNGTWWSIIHRRASPEQVEALFTILGGKEQDPFTGFAIYASTIANEPSLLIADIDLEWDLAGRKGRFVVANVLAAEVEPIRNPVTGAPHFIAIRPQDGFEFREAEMASGTFWSKGEAVRVPHLCELRPARDHPRGEPSQSKSLRRDLDPLVRQPDATEMTERSRHVQGYNAIVVARIEKWPAMPYLPKLPRSRATPFASACCMPSWTGGR